MSIFMPAYQSNRRRPMRQPVSNADPAVVEAYRAAHAAECEWIENAARRDNDFACSLNASLNRYGSLTCKQLEAVRNSIAREAQRAEFRRHVAENAPSVSVMAIETAFANAREAGVKRPSLTFAVFKFKPAPARGRNPGAIYVTDRNNDTYYGMAKDGKFVRSRYCDDDAEVAILRTCADPHTEALAYGKKFGVCCVCNRTLTDPKQVAKGIGPVCEKNYFRKG